MSPSSVSSDGCGGRSKTTSTFDAQGPTDASDALPMITTSSHFESAMPLSALWPKLAPSLSRSVSSERLCGRAASPAVGSLAVPAPSYGRVESPFDSSPPSSIRSKSPNDLGATVHAAFLLTRSRALKVRKHPSATFASLRSILEFLGETIDGSSVSVWTLADGSSPDEVWVVFKSHHDAFIFLSLSLPSFTILPALEADLDPFDDLRRLDLFPSLPVIQSHRLRMSISTPDFHDPDFVISTNPPNPRTTFRVGDWICNSVTCAAHNFGRNLACRGCGCPRSESQVSSVNRQAMGMPSTRLPTSPRFAGAAGTPPFYTPPPIPNPSHHSPVQQAPRYPPPPPQPVPNTKPASPSHPLLTPSGRSFSVGGKVQNVSSDPAVPCIMYWPDNEPFPEQGQIRPSNLVGVPPPILNTGNRGPIEHQPGDWICQKCNYLNWRRRKVCQTCYPYAEGNGDSISAAVQSERINLLTSLLAQNQLPSRTTPFSVDVPRRNTMTQMQQHRPLDNFSPPSRLTRSQIDLRAAAQHPDPQFIYETSGPHRYASPMFPGMRDLEDALPLNAPAPLLPSFLQHIVQSPTLSPTSSSSADLSIDEYDDVTSSPRDQVVARDDSLSNFPLGNIWRLNDEESTKVAGIALPHHEDLIGSRKSSQEILRRQSP